MPFYSFSTHTSTTFFLTWKIEESIATLLAQLPPQFLANFHSNHLASNDKIRQSLAVRIALYHLLQKLALPILFLSKNRAGKPILGDGSRLHISFTHTRYLAAVALSTAVPIGVDIEMIRPTLHRIQERFLTNQEVKDANNCLEQLAIYWSTKEALYKRLANQQIASFKAIFIAPFALQNKGKVVAHVNGKAYGMGYEQIIENRLQSHVLVWCEE